jgi:hypothetical protein
MIVSFTRTKRTLYDDAINERVTGKLIHVRCIVGSRGLMSNNFRENKTDKIEKGKNITL